MKLLNKSNWFLFLAIWCLSFVACQTNLKQDIPASKTKYATEKDHAHNTTIAESGRAAESVESDLASPEKGSFSTNSAQESKVPEKVYRIAGYIERHGRAPQGYVGGRRFQNREKILPRQYTYKEYDVNPKIKGKNRGPERLVLSDQGDRYYTSDHYRNFTKF